ncbi:MAG TPA: hypothetical protein PKE37_16165 [Thiomonas arsenitoxydans]|uniref:hypothetical protein n=1 Tax=Thiomonas arsenitoxydans (strain DSM 22701 / CIP 110005 / 3As) TaxID=426114 RepID=UPI002C943BEE|nr:hypothetical protein [Thiomonas arsenitoxydans]HML83290.1 hypothetical protein [Thiomonas arsenitoxydans]
MNMNNFPRGFEHATERNPLPRWARWLTVALVIGGYALLEAHDAATERAIAAADRPRTHVADATP